MSSDWVSCTCVLVVVCLQLGSGIELETQSVYYGVLRTAANTENHSVCTQELTQIYRGIDTNKRWAIKLLDASGTPETGLYWGNTYWPGSRQQCLAAASSKRVPVSRTSGPFTVETPHSLPPFPVHYYGAYFTHNSTLQTFVHWENEVRITLGLCLPSSCTETEIYGFLEEYLESGILAFQKLYETSLTMEGVKKTEDDYAWTKVTLFKIFILGLATTLTLCIVGTIYDVKIYKPMVEESKHILEKENDCKNDTSQYSRDHFVVAPDKAPKISFASKFIRCFSIDMNARSLFNTSATGDNTFLPFNGIRSFTMAWIIFIHGYIFLNDAVFNRVLFYYTSDSLVLQVFANGTFTVDTFISMSGFLLGFTFLESEMKKAKAGVNESLSKKMTAVRLRIIKRVARFLPTYLFALGFAYTISAIEYRQTIFWTRERNDITCQSNWWRNLLFINNLFPMAEICMVWSWSLSSDMQCFILGILLLTLATKYLKLAIFTFTSIFVFAIVYMGYITFSAGFIPFIDNVVIYLDKLYFPTWTRFGPYIIGIAGGCFLQYYNRKLPFNKMGVTLCWVAGVGLGTGIIFGFADRDMSLLSSALYLAFGRSVWALTVVWLIVACLSGNGGFINTILSHKFWIPIAKISYCVYLINPLIMKVVIIYTDSAWEFGLSTSAVSGFGFIMLSLLIAFAFFILFEAPFDQLIKLLLEDTKHKTMKRKLSENTLFNDVAEKKEI